MRHTFEVIIKAASEPRVRWMGAAPRVRATLIAPRSSPHCMAAPDN